MRHRTLHCSGVAYRPKREKRSEEENKTGRSGARARTHAPRRAGVDYAELRLQWKLYDVLLLLQEKNGIKETGLGNLEHFTLTVVQRESCNISMQ